MLSCFTNPPTYHNLPKSPPSPPGWRGQAEQSCGASRQQESTWFHLVGSLKLCLVEAWSSFAANNLVTNCVAFRQWHGFLGQMGRQVRCFCQPAGTPMVLWFWTIMMLFKKVWYLHSCFPVVRVGWTCSTFPVATRTGKLQWPTCWSDGIASTATNKSFWDRVTLSRNKLPWANRRSLVVMRVQCDLYPWFTYI